MPSGNILKELGFSLRQAAAGASDPASMPKL
jgi:hypothetical protein